MISPSSRFCRAPSRADHRRVAPGQLGDRIRRFLHPAVVGEPPVPGRSLGRNATSMPLARGFGSAATAAANFLGIDRNFRGFGRLRPPRSRRRSAPSATPIRDCRLCRRSTAPSPIILDDVVSFIVLAVDRPARPSRPPSCRRTSARSSAAESTPTRRTVAASLQDSRKCASGRCHFAAAAVSSSSSPNESSSRPSPAPSRTADRPEQCRPDCRPESPASKPAPQFISPASAFSASTPRFPFSTGLM